MMCGRFAQYKPKIKENFGLGGKPDDSLTLFRYNCAPGQKIFAVMTADGKKVQDSIRWGMSPEWMKGRLLINIRMETLRDKNTFRNQMKADRALVPMNGFYEWKNGKPYYFYPAEEGTVFTAAALISREKGEKRIALITVPANDTVGKVHHRMPALIPGESREEWILNDKSLNKYQKMIRLLKPYPDNLMKFHRVSERVNRTGIDNASLILPEQEDAEETLFGGGN